MNDPLPLRRWVIDTNVIVSRAICPHSIPARAFDHAIDNGRLLFSKETYREVVSVFRRPKFDRYTSLERRLAFLATLDDLIDWVAVTRSIRACRDPKDDKFLEVAVHGDADALVTGDADLLALHPFHGIEILRPETFLSGTAASGSAGLLQEPPAHYRAHKHKITAPANA